MTNANPLALIVGAGSGLSASLARKCAAAEMRVALAARHVGKLDALVAETHGRAFACDATDLVQVEALFDAIDTPDLVVYNPSYRVRGPFLGLDREEVRKTLMVTAYGGFLVAQAALKRMLERGRGSLFFTGASASVKGYAESAPFAMGKFALRGKGLRPVIEIMFAEFFGVALDQVITEAAKMRYLSNGRISVPMVIRAQPRAAQTACSTRTRSLRLI